VLRARTLASFSSDEGRRLVVPPRDGVAGATFSPVAPTSQLSEEVAGAPPPGPPPLRGSARGWRAPPSAWRPPPREDARSPLIGRLATGTRVARRRAMYVHLVAHARGNLAPLGDAECARWLWGRLREGFPTRSPPR